MSNFSYPNNRARSVAWFNTSPCHGEDHQFKSGRARFFFFKNAPGK